ncbi:MULTISPECIES: hypothetical protein [Rhodococcus]|uniref:Uncharacterized protein n=2 Tax=Rhodococcus erythropolis TaxID=1833 RepID=A0A6G9D4B7_RHOER|nr:MULTISPECIES: hypothetical protein [Rhodococcus]KPH16376.1 hypothetical protein AN948_29595 [Rhodococcus sp. ADH]MCJ0900290.1 hypothetical protein [Rhodococcus sp. ARC_M13]OFE08124.1 hypothetical protein A5N83_13935 [Rhodococcus sp. 1139]QIP43681.1 hypothetical protein G9444_6438 [Rhodococcus erythropolis]QOS60692.1 hypothetical protein IM699_14685 [Rhodococcus qingshengii]
MKGSTVRVWSLGSFTGGLGEDEIDRVQMPLSFGFVIVAVIDESSPTSATTGGWYGTWALAKAGAASEANMAAATIAYLMPDLYHA